MLGPLGSGMEGEKALRWNFREDLSSGGESWVSLPETPWVSYVGIIWRNRLLWAWLISKPRSGICPLIAYLPMWVFLSEYGLCLNISWLCKFSCHNHVSVWEKKRRETVVQVSVSGKVCSYSLLMEARKMDPSFPFALIRMDCNRWHICLFSCTACVFLEGENRIFCEGKGYICLTERVPFEPFGHVIEAQE